MGTPGGVAAGCLAMTLLVACGREEAASVAVPLSYNEAVYCAVAADYLSGKVGAQVTGIAPEVFATASAKAKSRALATSSTVALADRSTKSPGGVMADIGAMQDRLFYGAMAYGATEYAAKIKVEYDAACGGRL